MCILLAIDASSTAIGWVVLDDGAVRDHGEARLTGHDINDRCRQAYAVTSLLLRTHPDVDAVCIESPVGRFTKAVIPQALVSGAIRVAARLVDLHVVDVTPAQAKLALVGRGNAAKLAMQLHAARRGVTGEHAADALGVGLAAAGMVEVTHG